MIDEFRRAAMPLSALAELGVEFPTETSSNFRVTNLAESDVPIGAVLSAIAADPGCLPPRSGHAGNWATILSGASGVMDFNAAVCLGGWAEPVLHAFNQTESDEDLGDVVYRPGTVVSEKDSQSLSLLTWDEAGLKPRPRTQPYLVPYTAASWEGQVRPVLEVHGEMCARLGAGVELAYEAGRMSSVSALVAPALEELLGRALADDNPHGALTDLFGGQVLADGTVVRDVPQAADGHVHLADGSLLPPADVVRRVLAALALVERPEHLLAGPPPAAAPLLSTIFMSVLSAHLSVMGSTPAVPMAYLHWGARHMVGSPPRFPGYFTSRSTVRRHRRLAGRVATVLGNEIPIEFVLLPAVIFSLWLPAGDEAGASALAALLAEAGTACDGRDPDTRQAAADALVGRWWKGTETALDPRFQARFQGLQGVGGRFAACSLVPPPGFAEMPLATACSVVGALRDSISA